MDKLPYWVKEERILEVTIGEDGEEYILMEVIFHWWYVPIAWFNMWYSWFFLREA